MSVLKGEGKHPILFGSTSIPAGTRIHRGYLARPDLAGEWPTLVLVADAYGVTSSVKDLCRRLARHGYAALAPDLYRGAAPSRSEGERAALEAALAIPEGRALADFRDLVEFITNPAGHWSSAEHGFGVVGVGAGGRLAAVASRAADAAALALCYPLLDLGPAANATEGSDQPSRPGAAEALRGLTQPLLGLFGRDDELVPIDRVIEVRNSVPHAEFVVYDGVAHGFLDDSGESYDAVAFADALNRLTEFFEKHIERRG